jgi:signal transduction histidine kinase
MRTMYKYTLLRFSLLSILFFSFLNGLFCAPQDYQKDSVTIRNLLQSARNIALDNFSKAIGETKTALKLALPLKDNVLLCSVYRTQGNLYEDNNHLPEAYTYYEKALALKDVLPTNLRLDVYLDWAIINKKLSKYDITRTYYQYTLDLANQAQDWEIVEYVYAGLGTLYVNLGDFDKAIDYHLQSKEIAEKRNKTMGVIGAFVNISAVYMQSKNYKLAYEVLEKGYELAHKTNDSLGIAYVSNMYGKVLNAEKKYTTAITHHQKALTYCKENKVMFAKTLGLMADVFTHLQQYNDAEKTFKRCFEYSAFYDFYEQPNLYLSVGNFYVKTKRPKEAAEAFKKSLDLASKRSFIDLLHKGNRGLVDVYQQLGDSKTALKHMRISEAYEDSILNGDKVRRIAEAQYKFDIHKAETAHKLDITKSEKEIQALRLSQNRTVLLLLSSLIVAILISLFIYLKQKHNNNIALAQKNKEILLKNNRLEQSHEVLQQFAYASAYDLKEPLRNISGFVSIIDTKYAHSLPPESREYMNFVINGVKRMESLIGGLLEYSTLASADEKVNETTPVTLVLQDVRANLYKIIADKKADIEQEGIFPTLKVNRLHLTQLFQNLIGNAIKFSDKKPLIEIKGRVENGQYIIDIKDNGIGMEAEYSDKIFQLFQRLSRSAEYEGTGIGLSICKEIVDKYEGTIHFHSIKNEGTTFVIAFPEALIAKEKTAEAMV